MFGLGIRHDGRRMQVRVRVIWLFRMLSWDGPAQMARYGFASRPPFLFFFYDRSSFCLTSQVCFFVERAEDFLPQAHVGVVLSTSTQIPLRDDGCFSLRGWGLSFIHTLAFFFRAGVLRAADSFPPFGTFIPIAMDDGQYIRHDGDTCY